MTKVVARYSHTSSDDNRLLLLALTEAWGEKCYWCRKPKLFRELQIDHIVPSRPDGGAATDRDVDAVDNLAPICGPCNQEKSNGEFQNTPRVESQIELAAKRAATVQRTLDSFRRDAQVTKALLAITAADLNDERVAGAVEALGAVVLSVLRKRFPHLLDARFAEDLTVQRPPVEYEGRLFRVNDGASVIELDGKSRRASVVLEDVLGISLRYALYVVREAARKDADRTVERRLHRLEPFVSVHIDSKPSRNPADVYFYDMSYADGQIEVEGEISGSFVADVEEEHPNPDRWTQTRRAAFDYVGKFVVTFAEEGLMDISLDVDDVYESWSPTALDSLDVED